jgi:hypothetical protein
MSHGFLIFGKNRWKKIKSMFYSLNKRWFYIKATIFYFFSTFKPKDRLRLGNTQINLVLHSTCTIFAG